MRVRRLIPGLAGIAAVGLILGGLPIGFEPVGGDPDRIFRPIKSELARALQAGRLPFWSDRFGLGVPLLAESHAAALYPPNLVLYRLLDVGTAYRWSMWLHALAQVGATYAYARRLGITPWGGALAALAFALCGFQAIHSSHEWFTNTIPYLPLALLLADLYVANGRLAWLALLALVVGAQLTLGHFQIQTYTGGVVLLTGLWRVVADRRPWWRGLGLALALSWGVAIAAVQLASTWELAQLVGYTRRPFEILAFYSYPPSHWAELAVPRLFRGIGPEDPYWFRQQTTGFEACLYVGTVPLILAFVGLIGRERALGPWRLIVPMSLAVATMPRWWPLGYAALLHLPGLSYFRCPARYTVLTSLGLALLAGQGFDRALSARRFRIGLGLAVLFGAGAVLWGTTWSLLPGFRPSLVEAALAWAVGLATLAAWRRGWLGAWAPFLVTAVELGILFYLGTTQWGWSVRLPTDSPAFRRLGRESDVRRVAGVLDNLPVRVGLTTASPYLGFERNQQPPPNPQLAVVQDPRIAADPVSVRWLRRFGITHGVWDRPVDGPGIETIAVVEDLALDRLASRPAGPIGRRTWWVVRYREPFSRARAALRARGAPDRETLIRRLSLFDAEDEAWFLPGDLPPEGRHPRARSARVQSWDGREAIVEHDGTCDLIMDRAFYPGWTARVDEGPERPVSSADGGFQAVRLDGSGVSRVRVRYRPNHVATAARVALAALAMALLVLAASAVRLAWRRKGG